MNGTNKKADPVAWLFIALAGIVTVTVMALAAQDAKGACPQNVQCVKAAQVVHQAAVVHHAAPVVVEHVAYQPPVQNFFYSVGQPLVQQAAMTQAVKDALVEHQFQATVNATINGAVSSAGQFLQQQPAPQAPQPSAELPTFSVTAPAAGFTAKCAKCHANGQSKGGFSAEAATAEQRLAAIQRTMAGTMPPNGPLDPIEERAVVRELLGQ